MKIKPPHKPDWEMNGFWECIIIILGVAFVGVNVYYSAFG